MRELLQEIRAEAKMTQVQLAAALKSQQAIVSNIERGERRLDLVELWEVCDALGIDLTVFVRRFMQRCFEAERE